MISSIEAMKKSLLNAVADLVDSAIKKTNYLVLDRGVVSSSLGNGKYKVKLNGITYSATSRLTLQPGECVTVLRYNNKYNDMIIIS